jgi:hypothetical protein
VTCAFSLQDKECTAAQTPLEDRDEGKMQGNSLISLSIVGLSLSTMETAQAQPAKPIKRIIAFPAERYHRCPGARGLGSALATASAE